MNLSEKEKLNKQNLDKKNTYHPYRRIILFAISSAFIILAILWVLFFQPEIPTEEEKVPIEKTIVNIAVSKDFPLGAALDTSRQVSQQIFEDSGIEIHWLENINSEAQALDLLASGEADFALTSMFGAIQAYEKTNGSMRILAYDSYLSDSVLLAEESWGITSVAQLQGKKIGVEFGSYNHFFVLESLKTHGLSESDVTLIDMDESSLGSAYDGHTIDAGCFTTYDAIPYWKNGITLQLDTSKSNLLFLVGNGPILEDRLEITAKIILLFQDLSKYAVENIDDASKALSQANTINVAYLSTQLSCLVNESDKVMDTDDYDVIDAAIDFARDQGLINTEISSYRMVNFSYLNYANKNITVKNDEPAVNAQGVILEDQAPEKGKSLLEKMKDVLF